VGLAVAAPADGATITVKSNLDEFGVAGNCTLREAIQAADTDTDGGGCHRRHTGTGSADTIVLQGGAEYPISIPGGNEEDNATGDFDIGSKITIEVTGDGVAGIDANQLDRAIDIQPAGNLRASRLEIANGKPPTNGFSRGGAGILNQGRLRLTRSELHLNNAVLGQALNGGAVDAIGKKTLLSRVTIDQNSAGNVGGGINYSAGVLRVIDSVIAENTANSVGGGIELGGSDDDARVLVKATTISGNTAKGDGTNFGGGGISLSYFGSDGTMKATNVTFSGNTAWGGGGAVYSYTGAMAFNGATITQNTGNFDGDDNADERGGGVSGFALTFKNSIVDNNEDVTPTNPLQDCYFAAATPAHNLVSPGGGCAETGSNQVFFDPQLGPLADNGGPTPTHKVLKDSPAIGHAGKDAPVRDQRGAKRGSDPDIGAYER
jgi:CSLREA domain-containing protein